MMAKLINTEANNGDWRDCRVDDDDDHPKILTYDVNLVNEWLQ